MRRQQPAVQIVHSLISLILQKVSNEIDDRFYKEKSYKYTTQVSLLQLQSLSKLEQLRQNPIGITLQQEPKPLKADTLMTSAIQKNQEQVRDNKDNQNNNEDKQDTKRDSKNQTYYKQSLTHTLRRSKTFQEPKFKREFQSSSNAFDQLRPLQIGRTDDGYSNGLRQLKYDQEKYKGKKEDIKKPPLKKIQLLNPVYDYSGDILKTKQAESAHIIRTSLQSKLIEKKKTSLTSLNGKQSLVLHSIVSQPHSQKIITEMKSPRHSKKTLMSTDSQYTNALPIGQLDLKQGVRLIMADGNVIESKRRDKSLKDLVAEKRIDLNSKQFNRLKVLKQMQFEEKFKLRQEQRLIIKKYASKELQSAKDLESTKINPINTKLNPINNPEEAIRTAESQSNGNGANILRLLPKMKIKKYESLIRTRREGKNFQELMQERNKKFEDGLRTIS